jgi:hypothetical protein
MHSAEADLPAALVPLLTGHLGGEIVKFVNCGSGFTPGVAARVTAARADGQPAHRFVKAIRRDHPLSAAYQAEAAVGRALPAGDAIPALHWAGDADGWLVLIFDDAGPRTADLRPGSPDISRAIAAVTSLRRVTAPVALPTVRETLTPILHGWGDLARDPRFTSEGWVATHFDELIELEGVWVRRADGNALLHTDIRAANLVADEAGRVRVVDWAHACRGASWIDVAELFSHLVIAGHTPDEAGTLLADTPLDDADPTALTSFFVASAGYWRRSSLQPPPPGVPGLREFQARAADAAMSIVRNRIEG